MVDEEEEAIERRRREEEGGGRIYRLLVAGEEMWEEMREGMCPVYLSVCRYRRHKLSFLHLLIFSQNRWAAVDGREVGRGCYCC